MLCVKSLESKSKNVWQYMALNKKKPWPKARAFEN